jgi:hypothetical protein
MRARFNRYEPEIDPGESGYTWLYRVAVVNGSLRIFTTIVVILVAVGAMVVDVRLSNDAAPDSILGLVYATVGTIFLFIALVLFSQRRRSYHKREIGGLRQALGWHMSFGIMGMVLLALHGFGEFNPRSGTYALYGMIALVISGLVGRFLDRLMPRLIAAEVQQALTVQGDDRIESISQRLQAIVGHNRADLRAFSPGAPVPARPSSRSQMLQDQSLSTSWDLAYITMEATPQEVSREGGSYRFVPDRKSSLQRPGALIPGSQEHMYELEDVRQAMRKELTYRYITRYWRRFHILIALTTVALLTWHIVFALSLWLPLVIH